MTDQQLLQIARAAASIVETISEAVGVEPETPTEQPQWPQPGDCYWFINGRGKVERWVYRGNEPDLDRDAFHNMFRTKQRAQEELLRQKSMRPSFVPVAGQVVWVVCLDGQRCPRTWNPTSMLYSGGELLVLYRLGRIHPNEESARAWQEFYGDLWGQEPGNA